MNKILTYILVFITVLPTVAQNNVFSLEQALLYGIENNNAFKNVKLAAQEQREFAFEVMTEGFPKISAGLDYNYAFKQQVSIVPAGVFGPEEQEFIFAQPHAATARAELSQLVFDARYIYGLKARKNILEIADKREDFGLIDAKEKITKAYYQALVAQQGFTQLAANENVLRTILYQTSKLYEEGLVDELSVNRLELNLANLKTQIDRSKQQSENALLTLKYTIGMPKEESLELSENLNSLFGTIDFSGANSNGEPIRVEEKLLLLQDQMRHWDIKQARSNYFPSLYFYGSYGALAQRPEFNFFEGGRWFDFGMIGMNLKVPIFDGLKASSMVQQRKIQKEMNMNDLEDFRLSLNLQKTVAENNLANAINEYNTQVENVKLAQKIMDKTVIMFSEGIGSSFELSQAQQELTTTQINYTQAVYGLLVAQLELKKTLGKL
jgi:outer membrane protein TolC